MFFMIIVMFLWYSSRVTRSETVRGEVCELRVSWMLRGNGGSLRKRTNILLQWKGHPPAGVLFFSTQQDRKRARPVSGPVVLRCLERDMFTWLKWTESGAIIDKNDCLILKMHDHIEPAIAVDILKLASHRNQVAAIAKERRASIDRGVGWISAGELDNHDMAVQILKDKMRRLARAILVSHHGIYLKGAWPAIGHIVLMQLPPGAKGAKAKKEAQRQYHSYNDRQPGNAAAATAPETTRRGRDRINRL